MALTNAERQRRYRQKLKARASGEAAGDLVRAMVERAIAVLWRMRAEASPEDALIDPGQAPASTAQTTLDAFRAGLAAIQPACWRCADQPCTAARRSGPKTAPCCPACWKSKPRCGFPTALALRRS
jgi:hypothetical protein